jgi:hypothetical protein
MSQDRKVVVPEAPPVGPANCMDLDRSGSSPNQLKIDVRELTEHFNSADQQGGPGHVPMHTHSTIGSMHLTSQKASLSAFELLMAEKKDSYRHEALWLKCYTEAGGDETQAEIAYNRERAAMLCQPVDETKPTADMEVRTNLAGRGIYVVSTLLMSAVVIILMMAFSGSLPSVYNQEIGLLFCALFWLGFVAFVPLTWLRLKDAGLSPFWALLWLIPWVGLIPLLLGLIRPSKKPAIRSESNNGL